MGITRTKAKGRRESGTFVAIPQTVLNHPNMINLGLAGHKVLLGLLTQIRFGHDSGTINNGDLCATWSMMRDRIGSKQTLYLGIKELEHYGFIILSRQGEALRNDKPNLYAVTWWAIDVCAGKLDIPSTKVPPNNWKEVKSKYRQPKRVKSEINRNGSTDSVVTLVRNP